MNSSQIFGKTSEPIRELRHGSDNPSDDGGSELSQQSDVTDDSDVASDDRDLVEIDFEQVFVIFGTEGQESLDDFFYFGSGSHGEGIKRGAVQKAGAGIAANRKEKLQEKIKKLRGKLQEKIEKLQEEIKELRVFMEDELSTENTTKKHSDDLAALLSEVSEVLAGNKIHFNNPSDELSQFPIIKIRGSNLSDKLDPAVISFLKEMVDKKRKETESKDSRGSVLKRLRSSPDMFISAALQNMTRTFMDEHLNSTRIPHGKDPDDANGLIAEPTSVDIHKEMRDIWHKCMPFSYYFTPGLNELVVHIENGSQNEDPLRIHLTNLLKRHGLFRHTSIRIVKQSVGGRFCSRQFIGSRVCITDCRPSLPETFASDTNSRRQVLGIYLQYNGVIYWVSTAHGAVEVFSSVNPDSLYRTVGPEQVGVLWDRCKVGITLGGETPLPSPYLFFRYAQASEPGQPGSSTADDDFDLPHSIDIMVGQLPLTADDLYREQAGHEQLLNRRKELRMFGFLQSLGGEPIECIVTELLQLDPTTAALSATKKLLEHAVVYTCLESRRMIRGRVINWEMMCNLDIRGLKSIVGARNVLIIVPEEAVEPQEGHSGSVWVMAIHGSQTKYKAVAITVGYLENYSVEDRQAGRRVWIASLLSSSLSSLMSIYPNVFQGNHSFTPID